jgi:hypothetical protein
MLELSKAAHGNLITGMDRLREVRAWLEIGAGT